MTAYAFQPDYAIAPGETLKEVLEEKGMSQSELAIRCGLTEKTVSLIINGNAPLSYETAAKLELVLGVPASFWNNLESVYQAAILAAEEQKRFASSVKWLDQIPIKELINRGIIEGASDPSVLVHRALKFFGVSNVKAWEDVWSCPAVQFRGESTQQAKPGFVAAWIRICEVDAQRIPCEPYDSTAFLKAVKEIRSFTTLDLQDALLKTRELCAKCGVAFAWRKEIPSASVSGVTKWLSKDKAALMLSLKFKTDDQFWFSFFHEAGHILLHSKKKMFVDDGVEERSQEETEANIFARDILIPPHHTADLLRLRRKSDVRQFAMTVGVAPGIVVGRMQHERVIPYSYFNDLKVKYTWA